jgi:hypothetical protein
VAGTDRKADGEFVTPARGTRQQQASHVGARDQQHQPDHHHQHGEKGRNRHESRIGANAVHAGDERDRDIPRPSMARRWIRPVKHAARGFQAGTGYGARHPIGQARIQRNVSRVVRNRHVKIGGEAEAE